MFAEEQLIVEGESWAELPSPCRSMLVWSQCFSTWHVLPSGFQGCQNCCCAWQFSSKLECVNIFVCRSWLLHAELASFWCSCFILLNTTEPVNTLPSPRDILAHVKNALSEMSTKHIISGAKVSHYNKSPLQWIVLFLYYYRSSRPV